MPQCLDALVTQAGVENIEILVPCDDRIADVPTLQRRFPTVQFLAVQGPRTYAELRALAVRKARGTIIALTEDHCTPAEDWCARILRAHEGSHAAVGGAVEKNQPDSVVNWGLFLADYVRYANPRAEGSSSELTDCNVSYKQTALSAIHDVWRGEFHEPAVHAALLTCGESLWFSPDIVVYQQRGLRLSEAIWDRYAFGRLLGSGRVASKPRARRLVYAALTGLLPVLLLARVAGQVLHKRRYQSAFFRALPVLAALSTAWAWGEFIGYLTGRPSSVLRAGGGSAGGGL